MLAGLSQSVWKHWRINFRKEWWKCNESEDALAKLLLMMICIYIWMISTQATQMYIYRFVVMGQKEDKDLGVKKTCCFFQRTRIWIPRTYINAWWVLGLEDRNRDPQSKVAVETSLINELSLSLRNCLIESGRRAMRIIPSIKLGLPHVQEHTCN